MQQLPWRQMGNLGQTDGASCTQLQLNMHVRVHLTYAQDVVFDIIIIENSIAQWSQTDIC
jgi:hypothetical protein